MFSSSSPKCSARCVPRARPRRRSPAWPARIRCSRLWDQIYSRGLYADLWFRWKGKPLLMFGQHIIGGRQQMDDVRFPKEIRDFSRSDKSAAWTTLRWYDDGHDEWPWVGPLSAVGRLARVARPGRVRAGGVRASAVEYRTEFPRRRGAGHDRYDATTDTDKGLYFDQQWQRALEVDPEFIFVTGWNEWTAGQMNRTNPDYAEEMKKWDFPRSQMRQRRPRSPKWAKAISSTSTTRSSAETSNR